MSFIECSEDFVVIVLEAGDQLQWDGVVIVLGIVADSGRIGERFGHAVMQPVDDRRLLGGNVDQVW